MRQRIAELEAKARSDEQMRRQLHNTIQELKGNIRVFCRVRPSLRPPSPPPPLPSPLPHALFPSRPFCFPFLPLPLVSSSFPPPSSRYILLLTQAPWGPVGRCASASGALCTDNATTRLLHTLAH